jgi:uncharacterized membrane protein YeaQ/YmgE (transglycosylase-associated protein family)
MWILTGLVAGFAAGFVLEKDRKVDVGDLLAGLAGSMVGGFLFNLLGFGVYGFFAKLIAAFVGAVIVIVVWKKVVG